jgi:ABC-type Fe3+-hydroxamate transport system substrate-binding protein
MNMSSHSELIVDARGRSFAPLPRPARIVSLVPSLTELLFDLGLSRDEVAGRTKFCIHPGSVVRNVPVLGGTKTVDVPKLKALRPDLVIANIDENERETVEDIESVNPEIPVFVTHPGNIDESLMLISDFGCLFQAQDTAITLQRRLSGILQKLRGSRNGRVLYLIWRRPYMTITPATYIHSLLEHIGYRNVIDDEWLRVRYGSDDIRRYPSITLPDIVALSPDRVLFSSEPFSFAQKHIDEFKAALKRNGAQAPDCSIVDGELFSWYGSRLLHLAQYEIG